MNAYQGQPGGLSDPATPGGYCLARCLCGSCPQYADQRAAIELLRDQEYAARDRRQGQRGARHQRPTAARTPAATPAPQEGAA